MFTYSYKHLNSPCNVSIIVITLSSRQGLAHATGVHERNTVPMHETQFRGKTRIACQTQGKARFRHVSGTGLTRFRSIFGTVYARFRHVLGTVLAQLWHAVCTFYARLGTFLGNREKQRVSGERGGDYRSGRN